MKNFAEKAYQSTLIDKSKTKDKIERMLSELNINKIQFTKEGYDHSISFIVKLYENEAPRKIKIVIPFTPILGETVKRSIKRENAIFRVVLNNLKDRFVSVTNQLQSFDEVFLQDIVVIINGEEKRMGDIMVPMIRKQLSKDEHVILNIQQPK